MYFGMTTLSTVGFGDFYPVSNAERMMGCVMFLIGVTTFSFIFNSYMNMLEKLYNQEKDFI